MANCDIEKVTSLASFTRKKRLKTYAIKIGSSFIMLNRHLEISLSRDKKIMQANLVKK